MAGSDLLQTGFRHTRGGFHRPAVSHGAGLAIVFVQKTVFALLLFQKAAVWMCYVSPRNHFPIFFAHDRAATLKAFKAGNTIEEMTLYCIGPIA